MDASVEPAIGFIGLGRMGFPMAARLSSTVEAMVVYNRTRAVAQEFADRHGAVVASTPADLARQSRVILSMAESAAVSRTIYFGENGVIEGAVPGCLVIEMATVSPDDARSLRPGSEHEASTFSTRQSRGASTAHSMANSALWWAAPRLTSCEPSPCCAALRRAWP